MTRNFTAAVLVALLLEVLVVGYGIVVGGEQARASCVQDHGLVQSHECVRDGRALFSVPL